jgi:hypothetical protein
MRTTIELTDRQRAALLKLAAERGEKGFSRLVQEAIEHYLESGLGRRERVERAVSLLGTLSRREADALRASVRRTREGPWR